jgi:hypothetical protein
MMLAMWLADHARRLRAKGQITSDPIACKASALPKRTRSIPEAAEDLSRKRVRASNRLQRLASGRELCQRLILHCMST